MKIYIFNRVESLTNNYHSEGGLVVVADHSEMVNELIEYANEYNEWDDTGLTYADIHLTEEDWKNVIVYSTSDNAEPNIYIFPDAGCC